MTTTSDDGRQAGQVVPQETTTARGWGSLFCPKCESDTQAMTVYLDGLSMLRCNDCEEEMEAAEVEEWVAEQVVRTDQWMKVLAWLAAAPKREE